MTAAADVQRASRTPPPAGRQDARQFRGERREVARSLVYDGLGKFTNLIGVELDGITLIARTHDQHLGRVVYAQKSFELECMDAAMALIRDECGELLEGRTFLDIGANIGNSTVAALIRHKAARAIAIEPEPSNIAMLKANLALNGLDDRVVIHQLAMANETGIGRLALSPIKSGDHQISENPERVRIDVRLSHLDELDLPFADIGVVWSDAQGHEGHIFDGAGTLLDHPPIIAEFWTDEMTDQGGFELMRDYLRRRRAVIDIRATVETESLVKVGPDGVDDLVDGLRHGLTDLLLLPV